MNNSRYWKRWFEPLGDGDYAAHWCHSLFDDTYSKLVLLPYIFAKANGKDIHDECIEVWIGDSFDIGMILPDDREVYRQLALLYKDYKRGGMEGGCFYEWRLYRLYEVLQDYVDTLEIDLDDDVVYNDVCKRYIWGW